MSFHPATFILSTLAANWSTSSRLDLVQAVPDALERPKVVVEHRQQIRKSMSAPAQFALVLAVGFEPRDADQIARGQVGQAGEIKGPQGQPEFAALEQFAGQFRPAVPRQLVGAHIFIVDVRRRLDGFADGGGGLPAGCARRGTA